MKQENLERIKRLKIKCGFLDAEDLLKFPKTWLEYLQYEEVDVDISKNLYNANCTQKYFFIKKYFEGWDPKIHGPRNFLQSFYVADLIEECGNKKHYPLAMFINRISKRTRSSDKGTINDGTPSSSSYSEKASKIKK